MSLLGESSFALMGKPKTRVAKQREDWNKKGRWNETEQGKFESGLFKYGKDFKMIAKHIGTRDSQQTA